MWGHVSVHAMRAAVQLLVALGITDQWLVQPTPCIAGLLNTIASMQSGTLLRL